MDECITAATHYSVFLLIFAKRMEKEKFYDENYNNEKFNQKKNHYMIARASIPNAHTHLIKTTPKRNIFATIHLKPILKKICL